MMTADTTPGRGGPGQVRDVLRRETPLVLVLLVGLLTRVAMVGGLPQPLLTFTDANAYVRAANGALFLPLEGRTAGYPLVLRVLHAAWPSTTAVTLLQHGLALVAGVGLYVIARRLGVSRWLAAVPTALWLVPVDWLWLEHQMLNETLGTALAVAVLATAVLIPITSVRRGLTLGCACAAETATAGAVRPALLLLIPGVVLALALVAPRPTWSWRPAAGAVLAYASTFVVIAALYVGVQEHKTGFRGLIAPSLDMGAYVGMAPIADCSDFSVPAGTRSLCEARPPRQRPVTDFYYFSEASPGRQLATAHPELLPAIDEWGRRAAAAQAGDLRREHLRAFRMLFGLGGGSRPGYDYGPGEMRLRGADRRPAAVTMAAVADYYGADAVESRPGWSYRALGAVQRWTRPPRQLLLLALVVTLLGTFLGRGPARRAALAIGVAAWLPLLYATWTGGQFYTSVPSGQFLWRYTLPSLPLVGLATVVALAALLERRAAATIDLSDGPGPPPAEAA